MAIKCIWLLFLTFTQLTVTYSNSIKKFEELQAKKPLLETYWESYLSFPYDYSKPCINDLNPNPINVNAYGYDIKDIPDGVDIVNIAFASPHVYRLIIVFPVAQCGNCRRFRTFQWKND